MYNQKTKIICTLGPATDSVSEIKNLIHAGMNCVRLNFSHGSYEHHQKIIDNLHKAEKLTKTSIGILQDLQGPKIRTGKLKEDVEIKRGETIILTILSQFKNSPKEKIIPVQYKNIVKETKLKHHIFIDDGLIELVVQKKNKSELICKVLSGGIIKSHKGINVPDGKISAPSATEKDKKDLIWGISHGVDFIALSFVKSGKDIKDLKKFIKKHQKDIPVIAKIERREAVKNLQEIIREADGVMVARGDLGIEIPAEQVPIVQKRIIHLANQYGKPVITATQVLQSMVENPRATRAEISDAANAVFDNTDAIMLSNETAVGRYPFRATSTLSKVAMSIEKELSKHPELQTELAVYRSSSATNATCLNACELAKDTKANYIVAYTDEGYTAKQIAKYRPLMPVITVTPSTKVAKELSLVWGINKVLVTTISGKNTEKSSNIIKFLKQRKEIKKGDKVVVVCNASKKEKIISTFKI